MSYRVYFTTPLLPGDPLPPLESVSAVVLIARDAEGKVLCTRHKEEKRGWDFPGGHLESGEDILETLRREVMEEVGAHIDAAVPIATITSGDIEGPYKGKCMCIFATTSFTLLDEWTPDPEIADRALLDPEVFLEKHMGDRETMRKLIELANQRREPSR